MIDGDIDLVFDPLSQFGSFADQDVGLARFRQFPLAFAGQCHQTLVLAVDLHLTGADRTLFGQRLLRGRQSRFDLLDVGGRNESLTIVHFHFPPILNKNTTIYIHLSINLFNLFYLLIHLRIYLLILLLIH